MENLEKKDNDEVVDGVNVGALRALDECLLRGEKAFAKAEAGKKLTEEEEKDLRDFYHKLQLVDQVRKDFKPIIESLEPKANDSSYTKTIGTKK